MEPVASVQEERAATAAAAAKGITKAEAEGFDITRAR
jgi:hypothetical protein